MQKPRLQRARLHGPRCYAYPSLVKIVSIFMKRSGSMKQLSQHQITRPARPVGVAGLRRLCVNFPRLPHLVANCLHAHRFDSNNTLSPSTLTVVRHCSHANTTLASHSLMTTVAVTKGRPAKASRAEAKLRQSATRTETTPHQAIECRTNQGRLAHHCGS